MPESAPAAPVVANLPDLEIVTGQSHESVDVALTEISRQARLIAVGCDGASPGADDGQFVDIESRGRAALTAAMHKSSHVNLLHHSGFPVVICRPPADPKLERI